MRILIAIVFFFLTVFKGNSQKAISDSLSCSEVISNISYFWKLDSLANNGFRLYSISSIVSSVIDNITPKFLIGKLGKPNQVIKTINGIEYLYTIFNDEHMPKNQRGIYESQWLTFKFDKSETKLMSIDFGPFN